MKLPCVYSMKSSKRGKKVTSASYKSCGCKCYSDRIMQMSMANRFKVTDNVKCGPPWCKCYCCMSLWTHWVFNTANYGVGEVKYMACFIIMVITFLCHVFSNFYIWQCLALWHWMFYRLSSPLLHNTYWER